MHIKFDIPKLVQIGSYLYTDSSSNIRYTRRFYDKKYYYKIIGPPPTTLDTK